MLSYIEALEALAETGTMLKAATRLRLTQSAVSKRIATLEARLQTPLIEKNGRHVMLTVQGRQLLTQLQPLLAEFRSALKVEPAAGTGRLTLAVSESILSSWGAKTLAQTCEKIPQLTLELHAHRSPVVVDRVASGEYQLGLIAGFAEQVGSLYVKDMLREPMVLIPKGLGRLPGRIEGLKVISIEARSGTWSAIEKKCRALGLTVDRELESFFAVAQTALAGFGHGLVPLGVCQTLGLPLQQLHVFKATELSRPVSLIARPSTLARPLPQRLLAALETALPQLWEPL